MRNNISPVDGNNITDRFGLDETSIRSIEDIAQRRHCRAAINWLEHTEELKGDDMSASQQAQGFLEAIYHLCEARRHSAAIQILQEEVRNPAVNLSVLRLHSYLLYKGQGNRLAETVEQVLQCVRERDDGYFFLRMLRAEAAEILGDRTLAAEIYENLYTSSKTPSKESLEAFARLADCQIQTGKYLVGVSNLEVALSQVEEMQKNDQDPLLHKIKTNLLQVFAFYRMNTGAFNEAFTLYGQVSELRRGHGSTLELISPLAHQGIVRRKGAVPKQYLIRILVINWLRLLGLGWLSTILYRKLYQPLRSKIVGNYREAESFMRQAYTLCEETNSENDKAWISHHLGWVLLNLGEPYEAEVLAKVALQRGEEVGDQRSISDCHEQFGRIYLTRGNFDLEKAEKHLNRSLNIRGAMGSGHGVATSLLSLSFLYWHQGKWWQAFQFMFKSIGAYKKINMLNFNRFFGVLALFSVWTVGDRDWTA
jgi:tetratricopeptide (TPR) repeat protein